MCWGYSCLVPLKSWVLYLAIWCGHQKGIYSPSGKHVLQLHFQLRNDENINENPFLFPQVVYSLLCGFCALEWFSADLAFPSWVPWRVTPIMDSGHAPCSWQRFSERGHGQVFQLLWCGHINIKKLYYRRCAEFVSKCYFIGCFSTMLQITFLVHQVPLSRYLIQGRNISTLFLPYLR